MRSSTQKEKCIYPDIIIHRKDSKDNILIIEVKKTKNIESDEGLCYNKLKLKKYTEKSMGGLNYKYGVLVILEIVKSLGSYRTIWFQNGKKLDYNSEDIVKKVI